MVQQKDERAVRVESLSLNTHCCHLVASSELLLLSENIVETHWHRGGGCGDIYDENDANNEKENTKNAGLITTDCDYL